MRISRIFEIGDVVRVPFPFVERDRSQARPALVVSRPVGPDGVLLWTLMITSARRGLWPGDLPIGPDHAEYGLPIPCFIRTAKIAAIELESIERMQGRLSEALMARVQDLVRAALSWT